MGAVTYLVRNHGRNHQEETIFPIPLQTSGEKKKGWRLFLNKVCHLEKGKGRDVLLVPILKRLRRLRTPESEV